MADNLSKFGRIAKDLSKNPLSIIALFIVLIYAFATLFLGLAGKMLEQQERLPLIYFLVLFPVLVLVIFAWLVTKHHGKLYAPSDFETDQSFLRTLSPEAREERLEEEIESLEPAFAGTSFQPPTISDESARTDASELKPNAKSSESRAEIMTSYKTAEELALKEIETEMEVPLQRHIIVPNIGADRLAFDGGYIKSSYLTLIEVKFFRKHFIPASIIRDVIYRAAFVQSQLSKNDGIIVKLILLVVTDLVGSDLGKLKKRLKNIANESLVPTEVRFFNFSRLREKYPDISTGT